MKKTLLITFISLCYYQAGIAQNLVGNPSFEEYTICPNGYDQIYYATGWDTYLNTSDYYNSCSLSIAMGVPKNCYGYQLPSNPNCHAYAGLINYNPLTTYGQEFIGRKLDTTMTIGQKYFLEMKVSLANLSCFASSNLGFLFSTVPYNFNSPTPVNNFAHFNYPYIIADTANWTTIFGNFIADSAYRYIIIGNFFDLSHTDTIGIQISNCLSSGAYYYIDDVCVSIDSSYCFNYSYICGDGITNYEENNNILIFPNPSNDFVYIMISDEANHKYSCSIFNAYGKFIRQLKDPSTIIVSDLPNGIYLFQIKNENEIINKKIIINH